MVCFHCQRSTENFDWTTYSFYIFPFKQNNLRPNLNWCKTIYQYDFEYVSRGSLGFAHYSMYSTNLISNPDAWRQ